MSAGDPVTLDRGSGPPVLLLHGQPGDGSSWRRVVDRLVDRHRVLAPDRPGYGATDAAALGMAANADVMAGLLRRRGAAPATVVGHSWAGGVAVLMASRHPDVVRGLVLVGPVGTPDSVNGLDRLLVVRGLGNALTAAGLVGIGVVLPRLRRAVVGGDGDGPGDGDGRREGRGGGDGDPPPVPSPWDRMAGYVAATLPDEVLAGGWSGAVGRSRRTFLAEQRALMEELPVVTDHLADVAVPTVVVTGSWDVVVPPSAARTLADAIPGARLVSLPGVGHFPARDVPAQLADLIESVVVGPAAGPGR